MLCPQAHFLRAGSLCELCITGNLISSLKYRCVQGSLATSLLNTLATTYHHRMHYFDLIDVFVTTTRFMYQKMLTAGYPEQKLRYIPTFVNGKVFYSSPRDPEKKYIVYVGRLDSIKGVHVLIDAFALLRTHCPETAVSLAIAGTGDNEYVARLRDQVGRLGLVQHVQFLGELAVSEVVTLLSRAYLSVVPSLWYENLPNAVLESYASGTPVLASNLGSLPECVDEGVTGYLFNPGDSRHLAEQMRYCLDHPEHVTEMRVNCRALIESTYSEEHHLINLQALFSELISKNLHETLHGREA
jgi:glycosyltransferase involved in cell wall biosynthesis